MKNQGKNIIKNKTKSFLERYGHMIVEAPEYKDSVKYIRKMRDEE